MNCIGIDVSKQLLHVYNNRTGKYLKIDNNVQSIVDVFKDEDEETIILYEATGIYSKSLEKALNSLGRKHFHVHATDMHNLFKALGNHHKTDELDCKQIAQMGMFLQKHYTQFGGKNKLITPNSDMLNTMNAIMSEIRRMKDIISVIKQGFETIKYNIYCPKLAQKAHTDAIKFYEIAIDELYKEVKSLIDTMEYIQSLKNLQTIPGISKITAIELLIFFLNLKQKGFEKMDTKKAISYSGLNPIQKQSGTTLNQTMISKRGNKHIRTALYMPGMVRYGLCKKERYQKTNLGLFFLRMREKFDSSGKSRGKSVIAAMSKKLLCVARGMFWDNTAYNFS